MAFNFYNIEKREGVIKEKKQRYIQIANLLNF